MSAITAAEARRLGGSIETCAGCGRDFVRVRELLVDPRHTYRVLVPGADGVWTLASGCPVHSCTSRRDGP